jgi:hypothetical protein
MSRTSYPLKLPHSIKVAAARLAREDGVSLNQWIAVAVAEKVEAAATAAAVAVVAKAVVAMAAAAAAVVVKALAAAVHVKTAVPQAETTIDRTCLSNLLKQKGLVTSSPFFYGRCVGTSKALTRPCKTKR